MRVVRSGVYAHRWPTPTSLGALSHFEIRPAGGAWAIEVYRPPHGPELIVAGTLPEAHRRARSLSDNGLVGWVKTGA